MKRLATLVLLVILASVAGFVAPRPASACSCMQIDPAASLASSPAAFVGTLVQVDRRLEIGGVPLDSGFPDAVYRFEVEEWVKGDLGDFVDVHSAADGSACGIEVGIGNRAGVFLTVESGQLRSSLCSTIEAEVLIAGAKPLQVGAPGPAVLLVAGSIGGFDYVMLNERGEVVAGLNGPFSEPFEQPWQFSICPGSKALVEQWNSALVVRNLDDLSIIREVDLSDLAETTSIVSMRCVSEDGSEVLIAGEEWTGNASISHVFRVAEGVEPSADLPGGQVWLGDTLAVVQDHQSSEVSVTKYADGTVNVIHATPSSEEGPYTGIASIAIAPDDSSIAVLEVQYDGPNGTVSDLILFDADGTEVARTEFAGEASWLNWLESDQILVHRYDDDGQVQMATVVNATTLETDYEFDGWYGWNPVIVGQQIYASEGGTIFSADLSTGVVTKLETLPAQYVGPMAPLPADFDPSSDVIGNDPELNTPVTVPPLVSNDFGAGETVDVTITARIVLGVLAFGAVVAFVVTRRKPTAED